MRGHPRRRGPGPLAAWAICALSLPGWSACGGASIASPYPPARAIEPVGDDTGLSGTVPSGGSDVPGGTQNGNEVILDPNAFGALFGDLVFGRHVVQGEQAWRAAFEPIAGGRLRVTLWPPSTDPAQAASRQPPEGAPRLHMELPADAPVGVPMTLTLGEDVSAEAPSVPGSWSRVTLETRPVPGPLAEDAELSGSFEAHTPDRTLAGTFRARPLPAPAVPRG